MKTRGLTILLAAVTSAAVAQVPDVYSVDGAALASTKASLRSNASAFGPAYRKLIKDADKALRVDLVSVVDKSVVPPSGDKRDYMSQSRYWWPDPSKPDGRPYLRRDGESNPEILQLPDHENLVTMASSVSTLGLAYYFSSEPAYARRTAEWIRHWFLDPVTGMRPNLQFAQGVPGRSTGRGPGVLDGRHTAVVIDAIGLIRSSGFWTPADDSAMRSWLGEYVTWLTESKIGQDEQRAPNNHGTWYDAHVLPAALYAGRTEVARSLVDAASEKRILSQLEPDGRQPKELARTRPFHYSIFNLEAHIRLATQARRLGADLWDRSTESGRRLRAAVDYLLPFARDDKAWPHKDLDGVRKGSLALVLLRVHALTKESVYLEAARALGGTGAPAHSEWLLSGVAPGPSR